MRMDDAYDDAADGDAHGMMMMMMMIMMMVVMMTMTTTMMMMMMMMMKVKHVTHEHHILWSAPLSSLSRGVFV